MGCVNSTNASTTSNSTAATSGNLHQAQQTLTAAKSNEDAGVAAQPPEEKTKDSEDDGVEVEEAIEYDLGPKHEMQPIQTYINMKDFTKLTPNELDAMENAIVQIMLYQLSEQEHKSLVVRQLF